MSKPECGKCRGTGLSSYPNTTMNMGGVGGQMITVGPCPGTQNRPDLSDCPFANGLEVTDEG